MSSFYTTSIAINAKKGTVHLTGYDSNVFPKKAKRFESSYLSEMLQTQGREALDAYLLEQYQGGMMKGGKNEYNQTLQLYGAANMQNLLKLRQLKNDGKGVKFVISAGIGYLVNITSRRYKTSGTIERALKMDIIEATIKAKRIPDATVEAYGVKVE